MNGKGYGMPSSHAQFAFFFAVSLSLFLLVRHGRDEHEDIPSAAPFTSSHPRPLTTRIQPDPFLRSASNSNSNPSSPSTTSSFPSPQGRVSTLLPDPLANPLPHIPRLTPHRLPRRRLPSLPELPHSATGRRRRCYWG